VLFHAAQRIPSELFHGFRRIFDRKRGYCQAMSLLIVLKSRGIRGLMLLPWHLMAADQPSHARDSRRLECLAPKSERNLEEVVRGNQITCRQKRGVSSIIPTAQVTEIAYDFTILTGPEKLDYGALAENPFSIVFIPVFLMVESSLPRPHHFVFVKWNSDRDEGLAVFQLKENVLARFLAKLSQVTGKNWSDRVQELEVARMEQREAARNRQFQLRLNRPVRIGGTEIRAGTYQAFVWCGEPQQVSVLYVEERHRLTGTRTVAESAVDVLQASTPNRSFAVIYGQAGGPVASVTEIQTPRTLIRLRNN
jgi:hypothetical protein